MQDKLNLIIEKARRDKQFKFTSLMHLINAENLKLCYGELKRNKANGIDGMTVEEYGTNLDKRLENLLVEMKNKRYRPQPVRRVNIPKPGKPGEMRGLGIPAVEDKLVQLMVKKILESIFEPNFLECSHGFRPTQKCHNAVKALDNAVMTKPINYVVEVDIRKFFDTVSHEWIMRCLAEKITDPNIIWLVRRFLKAGVVELGQYKATKQGAPQGGVISPLIANIYMHYVLDLWFYKKFKPYAKGYMQLIRYCDDFVVCCENESDAINFLESLKQRLLKFNLTVAEEKTRIVKFGRKYWQQAFTRNERAESFNFLGFTHFGGKSRRGKWIMGHKTSKENLSRKLKEVKAWLRDVRNVIPLKDWWLLLKAKLTGHFNYFGISGNFRCIKVFRSRVISLAFKWLNRRSQKKEYDVE